MKAINVFFDDDEFKKLESKKGKMSWRKAILEWSKDYFEF